jgi:hypothetical protein
VEFESRMSKRQMKSADPVARNDASIVRLEPVRARQNRNCMPSWT